MQNSKSLSPDLSPWRLLGWTILCIRFVQGWIFWGGGSRRFIYDPEKLDPYAPQWMGNKIQSAMSGALFDVGELVSFLLNHFILLYTAIIVFSLLELLSGLGLIFGLFTRAAAMATVIISLLLMVLFGWQGTTCMDEWTMAVSNLSMALTLVITGGSVYSLDAWLMRRYPSLANKSWFALLGSAPWSAETVKRVAQWFFFFTIFFTLATYNYYRGAILSPYHDGPVSAKEFHLSLKNGQLQANGSVSFNLNVNAGPTSSAAYIVRIELQDTNKNIIEFWSAAKLSQLPKTAIRNEYQYNQITTGTFGLKAPESAKAEIVLPPLVPIKTLPAGQYKLIVYTVDGLHWELALPLK